MHELTSLSSSYICLAKFQKAQVLQGTKANFAILLLSEMTQNWKRKKKNKDIFHTFTKMEIQQYQTATTTITTKVEQTELTDSK